MKKQRFAGHDRRRAYPDIVSNAERVGIAVVFGMMVVAFAWFWLEVIA